MLYRALNPVYAREPMSGRGAQIYGGRFNKKGVPALYTALTVLTALREAHQVGNLQPTMLIAYEAEIDKVFDARDETEVRSHGMTMSSLSEPTWRDQMRRAGESKTQVFAQELSAAGYSGLLVRSFAAGAGEEDLNLVLWRWGPSAPQRLVLVDDEKRLSR